MQFIPHQYQQYAINRIVSDYKIGLYLDMGLGKTVITLTAINELRYNRWAVAKCLVIAPKKVAEATWQHEAQQWDHLQHLKIVSVLGSVTKRVRALNTPADIWVINRECRGWSTITAIPGRLTWWCWTKAAALKTAGHSGFVH